MARPDKVDSTVGVVRGTLAADIAQADWGKVIGVSVNASGLTVRGSGGVSGTIGVIVPDKTNYRAGQRCDIFKTGEIVEVTGLTPGVKVYADNTTGLLTATVGTNVQVGYMQEADRLVVQL
jgi:hypothetical protein